MKAERLVMGILAHVDAGKTTLAESILYHSGSINKQGRVDHQDTFLDNDAMERARGITIFSKQAELVLGQRQVTLLDTPGHVDFSAEMERTLQVLDAAILVINGSDGVQGHTQTLWKLLKRYEIPVFLFINKMDQPGTDQDTRLKELQRRLDEHCLDFTAHRGTEEFLENLAVCDEAVMDKYLQSGMIENEDIVRLIAERKIFPCYFGSALKNEGIEAFLKGIEQYAKAPDYGEEFGARVFKIARDGQNNRLTYMKITGGRLRVKTMLGSGANAEKADQIRIYSGSQYQVAEEVAAGVICAVTGLEKSCPGTGLGAEKGNTLPVLEPVLTYRIQLPEGVSEYVMYSKLCQLEEEEPQLHVTVDEAADEIHVQVMGEVQIEILKTMIRERFGFAVEFGTGNIVYKETIEAPVIGLGHFEPLRHYAEVHLLMEPAERGSGLQFESNCSEDILDRNWQRLVLTHLQERQHKGVLTGAEITDMKITLIAGKAHPKHTEGGDFRQATYRAVRQGLRCARSILLEPVYEFRLEVPTEMIGRAMADIGRMQGHFDPPRTEGEMSVLTGSAPVVNMQGYQMEVMSYSKGYGGFFCSLKGYEPCHNAESVIREKAYVPEADMDNPTGSVFCTHGAGFIVEWDKVAEYIHIDSGIRMAEAEAEVPQPVSLKPGGGNRTEEKELEEIFARTYGTTWQKRPGWRGAAKENKESVTFQSEYKYYGKERKKQEEYLLVDGYNIIFAWPELKELAEVNLAAARNKLADILCNYQGYKKNTVILVFDAYRVEGNPGESSTYLNIHVVYTKEAETADMYIEKVAHEIGRKYQVTVATSDALEQMIIWGQGAARLSAAGLKEEIEQTNIQIKNEYQEKKTEKNYLFDHLPKDMAELMEDVRLGKRKFPE